jgi:hypothetical protein
MVHKIPSTVEIPFSIAEFSKMKFPKETLKTLKPYFKSAATQINEVFVKYNMTDNFVLALVHRHHDLIENELLVETVLEDKSVTEVVVTNGTDEILSHIWTIKAGKLAPF